MVYILILIASTIFAILSAESTALIGGAVFGVIWRAKFTRGQNVFSKETAQDAFIGSIFGVLWNLPFTLTSVGGYNIGWPPFPVPHNIGWIQKFGIMAIFTWLFIEHAKRALLVYAPKYFEKWTGIALNGSNLTIIEPGKDDKPK